MPTTLTHTPKTAPRDPTSTKGAHVALFMHSFAGGGAERVMVNLAEGLAARGLRVDMVVVRPDGPYRSLLSPDVRLVDLGCRRALRSLPPLVRYLRRERPAALLSAMGDSNLIALWARIVARYRGRVVVSVHINLSRHYQGTSGFKDRFFPFLYRRFYPGADAVVAVSQDAADDLTRTLGLPANLVQRIYNPVVTPALFAAAQEPVTHPWFAPGEPPVILSVGRLCAQKDFLMLIQAFAQVHRRQAARLVILGEGPDRAALEQAVAAHGLTGAVDLPGFAANPYAYMSRAAAYVLSSRWEGLPTVLIEALACGARVVSTDCPSGPREILRDGQIGRLVPVGDAGSLADALEETLGDATRGHAPPEAWAEFHATRAAENYEKVLLSG